MNTDLKKIVLQFQIEDTIQEVVQMEEGFINDTFFVNIIDKNEPAYILQRKNSYVFRDVPAMMNNIHNVTKHIKQKISEKGGDTLRESLTLIPSRTGELFFKDKEGEYWTMCLFIPDSINFQTVDSPDLAYSGGKAVGIFQSMLADFHKPLADILPGFHHMKYRFEQWDEALNSDAVGRKKELNREIEWIESRRNEMLDFFSLVEKGVIPPRVAHNDTKISNVLFDREGRVLCLIDLDTVLTSTVLYDFGDAVRTYANTGKEDDQYSDNVSLNLSFFEAFSRGYLEQAVSFLTQTEIDYLAFSAKYITFEQVLRFLMDYINGDKYYKIKYPNHNLQRTVAQYWLLLSMEEKYEEMMKAVKNILNKIK